MSALPLVSVIIPMRNEADSIAPLLDDVLAQEYPAARVEILVVDGASTDGSTAVLERYAGRDPRIHLLHNPRRIVPTALNIGIRAASGDVICRLDGHTRIAPDYLRRGVEALERTGADNVGGPMHAVGGGWFGDAVAVATASRFGIGSYFHFGTEERDVDTVYLGMWPRQVFERIGLFDEELVRNQDDELNYRLRKAGGRIVLIPAMRSWYQNRQSVASLLRQYYQYGQWKVRVLQKHPRQMSWRHFVPPLFVAALGTLVVLGAVSPLAAMGARVAFATYATAVLIAAGRAAWGRGLRAWLAAALAFACIHAAWGAGFLHGLFRFADRWRTGDTMPPRLAHRESAAASTAAVTAAVPGGTDAVGRTP